MTIDSSSPSPSAVLLPSPLSASSGMMSRSWSSTSSVSVASFPISTTNPCVSMTCSPPGSNFPCQSMAGGSGRSSGGGGGGGGGGGNSKSNSSSSSRLTDVYFSSSSSSSSSLGTSVAGVNGGRVTRKSSCSRTNTDLGQVGPVASVRKKASTAPHHHVQPAPSGPTQIRTTQQTVVIPPPHCLQVAAQQQPSLLYHGYYSQPQPLPQPPFHKDRQEGRRVLQRDDAFHQEREEGTAATVPIAGRHSPITIIITPPSDNKAASSVSAAVTAFSSSSTTTSSSCPLSSFSFSSLSPPRDSPSSSSPSSPSSYSSSLSPLFTNSTSVDVTTTATATTTKGATFTLITTMVGNGHDLKSPARASLPTLVSVIQPRSTRVSGSRSASGRGSGRGSSSGSGSGTNGGGVSASLVDRWF